MYGDAEGRRKMMFGGKRARKAEEMKEGRENAAKRLQRN
jgi:hypothetical protein